MTQLKHKTLKYYIIGTVAVIICLFGTLELSTRLISWIAGKGFTLSLHEYDPLDRAVTSIYQWHPFTGITFKPEVMFTGSHPYQKGKAKIQIDRYGFLTDGHPLTYKKSQNEIRIATIGSSTTANINLSFEENWPGYLGKLIQKELPKKRVTIINAGVPGFDTAQSIANLALRVMPFEPDIVIIYHLYNDLKAVRNSVSFSPDYSHIHRKPFGFYKQPHFFSRLLNNSMMYVRLRNKELRRIEKRKNLLNQTNRLTDLPEQALKTFEQHIGILVSVAKAGGAEVILSSFATLHDPHLNYSNKSAIHQMSLLQKKEIFSILNFTPSLTIEAIFKSFNKYNLVLREVAHQKKTGWVDSGQPFHSHLT